MKIKKNIRFLVLYIFIGLFFAITLGRLFYLQILCADTAQKTVISYLSLSSVANAPRGNICDRNGTVLAGNRKGYMVLIKKGSDEDLAVTIKNLAEFHGTTYEELLLAVKKENLSFNNPYIFTEDADFELITKIKEAPQKYPCAEIITQPIREYFYPTTAVHLLGRCGIISKEEYEKNPSYARDDYIGKQGAERAFEEILRGIDGTYAKEKYVDGKEKKFCEDIPAIPGKDVFLTIDLSLQQHVEEELSKVVTSNKTATGGAVVITDVNSGEILALASNPTYNITEFSKNYNKLSKDERKPFFNRSLSGLYEPGSTFKPITAIASLESGDLEHTETMKTLGKYQYFDRVFRCNIYREKGKNHGTIDVSTALGVSCNYFFYELGARTGIDKISTYAKDFGLDSSTGIELSKEEAIGTVATPKNRKARGGKWYAGDTLQAAIGQSDNLFTPVAMSAYAAALANGGTLYSSHILKAVGDLDGNLTKTGPEILNTIDISAKTMQTIKEGMLYVTQKGTAKEVFRNFPIEIAGKTGTAQVGNSTNGLFIGYAPADNPKISFCVVIEGGKSAYSAATVLKNVLSYYIDTE